MSRFLGRLAGGFAVVGLLCGLPAVLVTVVRLVRWDVPLLVAQPLSAGGVVAFGVVLGGLVWVALVRAVVLDVVAAVRRVDRRPRLPVPLQTAVTAAVSGIVMALDAGRAVAAGPAVPQYAATLDASAWQQHGHHGVRHEHASSTPQQPNPGPAGADDGTAPGQPDTGVVLPDGWLPLPMAAAVATAVTMAWVHRRRRYVPRSPTGSRRDDRDLLSSRLVARLIRRTRTAIEQHHDGETDDVTDSPTQHQSDGPEPTDLATDLDPLDQHTARVLDDLFAPYDATAALLPAVGSAGRQADPAGVVGLVGPGAASAMRGLLIAAATHHSRRRVVVTPAVATELFSATIQAIAGQDSTAHLPGRDVVLDVVSGDIDAGMATLLGSAGPQGTTELVRSSVEVVRFDAHPIQAPGTGSLSSAAIGSGGDRPAAWDSGRARVVLLGVPDTGTAITWHVTADGTAHPVGGIRPGLPAGWARRLPALDRDTTTDLLITAGLLPAGYRSGGSRGRGGPTDPGGPDAAGSHTAEANVASTPDDGGEADAAAPDLPWPDVPSAETGAGRRLLVRVLGRPVLLLPHPDGSHSPIVVRRSAGWQILVLLALHRTGMNAAGLKEAIWPDVASGAAHRRFLTTVSELRRTLHTAAGEPVLRQQHRDSSAGGTWYWLDPAMIQVDLWRLHDLLDAAAGTVDPTRRRTLLQDAAGLSGGEVAEPWDHEWLTGDRERTARHFLDICVHLADLEPHPAAAVPWLRRALRYAPANEAVYRRLLHCHAAAGDIDGLRRAAATLTEHLTALHVQPEPATIQLLHDVTTRHDLGRIQRTPATQRSRQ